MISLTDALDDTDELVFFDQVHTNEHGAQVVSEALYASLRPRLLALSP